MLMHNLPSFFRISLRLCAIAVPPGFEGYGA